MNSKLKEYIKECIVEIIEEDKAIQDASINECRLLEDVEMLDEALVRSRKQPREKKPEATVSKGNFPSPKTRNKPGIRPLKKNPYKTYSKKMPHELDEANPNTRRGVLGYALSHQDGKETDAERKERIARSNIPTKSYKMSKERKAQLDREKIKNDKLRDHTIGESGPARRHRKSSGEHLQDYPEASGSRDPTTVPMKDRSKEMAFNYVSKNRMVRHKNTKPTSKWDREYYQSHKSREMDESGPARRDRKARGWQSKEGLGDPLENQISARKDWASDSHGKPVEKFARNMVRVQGSQYARKRPTNGARRVDTGSDYYPRQAGSFKKLSDYEDKYHNGQKKGFTEASGTPESYKRPPIVGLKPSSEPHAYRKSSIEGRMIGGIRKVKKKLGEVGPARRNRKSTGVQTKTAGVDPLKIPVRTRLDMKRRGIDIGGVKALSTQIVRSRHSGQKKDDSGHKTVTHGSYKTMQKGKLPR